MSDDLRERVARAFEAAGIDAEPWHEQYCAKCGAPRSNHPYRHPFVSAGRPSIESAPVKMQPRASVSPDHAWEPVLPSAARTGEELRRAMSRAIAEGKDDD